MHTILVADDSVTIQRAVEIVFDKEPFTVVKAGSGSEALARARDVKPHVVLVDHTMPDQSGYDLAAALKADPSTQAIPVLFFSATANPYDEHRGRAAGISGFVQKPFDCQTLLDRVRGLLGVEATAPGTFASTAPTAAASAATASLPRPPSLGGLGGLPRPPGVGGVPRPGSAVPGAAGFGVAPVTASSVTTSANPIAVPATTSAAGKPLDPFGFGTALSQPPQPSFPSSPPQPAAPASTAAATSTLSSPAAVAPAPANSGWQAVSAGKGPGPLAAEATKSATPSWMPTQPTHPTTSQPTHATVAPTVTKPSVKNDDLMEISDIDVVGDPTPARAAPLAAAATGFSALGPDVAKITAKLSLDAIEQAAAQPSPTAATTTHAVARAVDTVVERAAPAVQAVNGNTVSREALSAEARAIIEKIVWEVVPELAEVIIKEELKRLLQAKRA